MHEEPLLRVVRGAPTDEELAALVGVLLSRSTSADASTAVAPPSTWARSGRPASVPHAGPGAWRASGLPR